MKIRMETVTTLEEELFLMQTLGDDRSVRPKCISLAMQL
jgi:guanine deaminase